MDDKNSEQTQLAEMNYHYGEYDDSADPEPDDISVDQQRFPVEDPDLGRSAYQSDAEQLLLVDQEQPPVVVQDR